MEVLILICSIISFMVSLPALAISIYTLIELKAMKKSTHKIEYMPVPMPDIEPTKKQMREFGESLAGNEFNDSFIV